MVLGLILFVRFRRSSDDDNDKNNEHGSTEPEDNGEINNGTNDYIRDAGAPDFYWTGEHHSSGYEVLEYPKGSGVWWWKDYNTEQWVLWKQ